MRERAHRERRREPRALRELLAAAEVANVHEVANARAADHHRDQHEPVERMARRCREVVRQHDEQQRERQVVVVDAALLRADRQRRVLLLARHRRGDELASATARSPSTRCRSSACRSGRRSACTRRGPLKNLREREDRRRTGSTTESDRREPRLAFAERAPQDVVEQPAAEQRCRATSRSRPGGDVLHRRIDERRPCPCSRRSTNSEMPVAHVVKFCHLNQCSIVGISPGSSSFFSTS